MTMVRSLRGVAIVEMPDPGTVQELLARTGIEAGHIAAAAPARAAAIRINRSTSSLARSSSVT